MNTKLIVFNNEYNILIQKAREALPAAYNREDTLFTITRLSMLILSLIPGEKDNLEKALDDKIHQQNRYKLIPEISKIKETINQLQAIGHYLSGSGATLIVVLGSNDDTSEREIRDKLEELENS